MRKNKLIVLSVMAVSAACLLSGCFGSKEDDDPSQVVVVETPTPAPTIAPVATATPVPQVTTYTSSDKSISISLPDSTWSNRMDEGDTISFESKDGDRILILHGKGEEAMSQAVLPDTRENASALTATSDIAENVDFEITNYSAAQIGDANVYTYTVNYADAEKGGGYTAVANYVLAAEDEFYSVAGSVKNNSNLAKVQSAMKSFKVLNAESSLASATTAGSNTAEKEHAEKPETSEAENTDTVESTESSSGAGSAVAGSGMVLYNSEGVGFDVYSDGSSYTDGYGNYFYLDGNGDVYDEYGNYYPHSDYYEGGYDYSYDGSYDSSYDESYDYNSSYDYSYGGMRDFVTSSGVAFGVYQDANGDWIDGDGNYFYFDENGVAYDQFGNAYNPA